MVCGSIQFQVLHLQELEPRRLLSGYQPTDVEQVFLERLNDARANPVAYGAAIGLDLSSVLPAAPLGFNPILIQSARDHSLDMSVRNYLDHVNPEGQNPADRMRLAGLDPITWSESLAGGYLTPEDALRGLILDSGVPGQGHRRQLLAMDPFYQSQNQVGVGIVLNGSGSYRNYYTIDAALAADARPLITGVVFDDRNGNGEFDPGEGLPDVTITVWGVGSTTTFATGGYSIPVDPGTYTVTASGSGLIAPNQQTITVGVSNYRLNFSRTTSFIQESIPVTVVNDAFRHPMNFVLGLDDQVYAQKFDAAGNPSSGYFLTSPGQVKSLTVGNDGHGNPEVFVIGLNDLVYALRFDGNDNPVNSYFATSGDRVKTNTLGSDANGRPEVFAMGLDDQVYAQKFDLDGIPASGFFLTAEGRVKTISTGKDQWGSPELFVIGLNDLVYAQKLDSQGNPASGYFFTSEDRVKSITVGHDGYGNPEIFAIGLNDQVYAQKFDALGNPSTGFFLTAEGFVKNVIVTYDSLSRPQLFATSWDDQVYSQQLAADGYSIDNRYWLTRPGRVKALSAVQDAAGAPELFVIGLDDQVYAQKFDGSGNSISDYFLTDSGRVQ
jgi:uncharacterized protein YkwD